MFQFHVFELVYKNHKHHGANAYHEAVSFSNGNWQSQYVLFIKMLQVFGPKASIYCPGAAIIHKFRPLL